MHLQQYSTQAFVHAVGVKSIRKFLGMPLRIVKECKIKMRIDNLEVIDTSFKLNKHVIVCPVPFRCSLQAQNKLQKVVSL